MKPNLFNYATSELSQDAFLCWLFMWADDRCKSDDEELHNCALKAVKLFTNESVEVHNIVIKKQWNHIDVLCIINDDIALVIEDKTFTKDHDNQLERYKAEIVKLTNISKTFYAYYKSDLISPFERKEVEKADYKMIDRSLLLSILRECHSSNGILHDYTDVMQHKTDNENKYLSLLYSDWQWDQYKGFYNALSEYFDDANWKYVSNSACGFLGFHWLWHDTADKTTEYFLQFENCKLKIKVAVLNKASKGEVHKRAVEAVIKLCKANNISSIHKARTRLGQTMTIADVDTHYWLAEQNGLIDMEETVRKLKALTDLMQTL
ncbi:MAG: PD-(D/E)XK nuclease family protein [Spirochaetales bacterium]|nr:PD-(D/E)XK nuclease family protein [Spirochaetales bacterium]